MGYISAIKKNNDILVWERNNGKREIANYRAPYYFYTKSVTGDFTSIYGDKLERHTFATGKEFNLARAQYANSGKELFESDITPTLKLLSEQYYNKPTPELHVSFYDIENDYSMERGYATIEDPYAPINSVAIYNNWQNRMMVYAVPPEEYTGPTDNVEILTALDVIAKIPTDCSVEIILCKNEEELLLCFLEEIDDSDVISGWNSIGFDDPYTAKRLGRMNKRLLNRMSFSEGASPRFKEVDDIYGGTRIIVELSGRIQADYLEIFKKYEVTERPSFKLEAIADEILIDEKTKKPVLPKLEYEGSLADLYHNDFLTFIRYNLRDTEILKGFEERLGYIELANQMYHMSTGLFQHVTGTVKLSDLATVNYCHHELNNLIVNDSSPPEETSKAKGAFVLLPQVGEHKWIGSIDINSLYPSVIRSLNISPEMIIGQFVADEDAFTEIRDGGFRSLSLLLESGEQLTKPADEWKDILKEKNWSISGFGTVFSQEKQGIMPAILEYWYAKRKEYQALMAKAKDTGDSLNALYYDKLQYVYKIKLNSYYGALLNGWFRFYDKRLGESTTATSRAILLHQCAMVTKLLDGKYMLPNHTAKDKAGKEHFGYTKGSSLLYGDSVAADTNIILEDGIEHHISTLFECVHETHENGKEYYFPENMKTLTYDEHTNKTGFEDVKYVMRHRISKKMFRVWLTNSTYVDVTEDHSLIGYKNTAQQLKNESCLVEVKPEEIGKDIKSLIFLKTIPRKHTVNREYSKELYEFLGLIIGDGYAGESVTGGVDLSTGAQDIDETSKKILDPLIEQGYITSYAVKSNGHDIRICGAKIYHFVREHLYAAGAKDFPKWMFNETITNIGSFLRGYFSAAGTVYGTTVSLCSVNIQFIKQAQRLLFYCGIASNYFTETTENSYNSGFSGTYSNKLSTKNNNDFAKLVGFLLERKQNKIPVDGRERKYLSKYDFAIQRGVHHIEEIEYDGYVYDIEVGNTHVFFANNVLVHNTDSSYFLTHGNDQEEATIIADTVGTQVDASFKEFMQEAFLCSPDFDGIIKTARENVASNSIFIDKKRYILRIVDSDGYKCDKMKIMGVELKKTTLPKHVQKVLINFVEQYLKGKSWEDLATDIVKYKDTLYNTEQIMDIGLPKGIRKVEYYTGEYEKDKTCRLPGHVAAAIHYNACLTHYNDNESMKIVSGMKIKVFYLTKKIGKFKSIAIPTDIQTVPQWFLDNYNINKDMHIERLIDKPLDNIIKAINKTVPTRQSLLTNSLLDF